MKSIKKLFAMGLALMMALSIPFSVSAAELEDAPIDESGTGSLRFCRSESVISGHLKGSRNGNNGRHYFCHNF